jgi:hypothetical protein
MKKILTLFILLGFVFGVLAQDEIIFFSDSPDGNKMYDASWGYKKAPSYLELAGNGDKFPVDPLHPHNGAHSLRLHWISKTGGDWGIAVASVGWVPRNVTEYDSLVYFVNGPAAIAQNDLPDLGLEDTANKKSTRIWLGDYFSGVDDDSLTWQKIMLPVSAFQPGTQKCDFTKVKTIFHFQKNADEGEHIAWLDDIRMIKAGGSGSTAPLRPVDLAAAGADSRCDLQWKANAETDLLGYYIYWATAETGPFGKLNPVPHDVHLYSHFSGVNEQTYFYYVTAVNRGYLESQSSDTVSARTRQMTEDELLTSVQEATFKYFYHYGHPVSGLTRERKGSEDVCTSGGTGFGLMALVIGSERGFVIRDSAATRTLKMLRFLEDVAERHHGAWSHWLHGATGKTIPFGTYDDGGDLVETAYLVQGLLCSRQYFTRDNAVENEIRLRATRMWESVEWNWYRRFANGLVLFWHWSPNVAWQMNMPIKGYNETMITYLLAIAAPIYGVPAALYADGWASNLDYANGNSYYGYKQWVGKPYGGPLFFTHYSFLGFDPRPRSDRFCNYFENSRNISLIHRAYCMDNPKNHTGYSELVWGLTASDYPGGYTAQEPMYNDNGTITPTAALSAMPYTPEESIATLKHFYHQLGPRLWGEFGFRDAFNLNQDWFAQSYIAIDQGPIIIMMENYRTQLCWNLFMANPEIDPMLDAIGWTSRVAASDKMVRHFELHQNYPNPFNAQTTINFSLAESVPVTLELFNVLGEKVATIYAAQPMAAGLHQTHFDAKNLSSGIYFFRLQAGDFRKMRRMVLVR